MKTMYTGITFDEWVEASKEGLRPHLYGESFDLVGLPMVTYLTDSPDDGSLDGFIEGFLPRIYGVAYQAKVKVLVPDDIHFIHVFHDPDTNEPYAYLTTDFVPPENLSLVEAWETGPELVEGIIGEWEKGQHG